MKQKSLQTAMRKFLLTFMFAFIGIHLAKALPPNPTNMILEIQTTSENQVIDIPLFGTNNAVIDWGDGSSVSATNSAYYTHYYATPGTYYLNISGSVTHFGWDDNDAHSNDAIIKVLGWGNLGLTDLKNSFVGCSNLTNVPDSIPSGVTNCRRMFASCTNFNDPNISSWNMVNVTNTAWMFMAATSFNQPLNNWNVSNVTDMSIMFYMATDFNQSLNNWNVSNVTDMGAMFAHTYNYNQPMNNWNVSNVTNMGGMFYLAYVFNQDLSSWCVSNFNQMPDGFDNGAGDGIGGGWYANYRPNWGAPCAAITCAQPSSPSATPSHNNVVLSWTKAGSAVNTQVQFRLKNTGVWGGTSVSGTSHTFNNLSPNTTYEYRLRSLCNGLTSSFTTVGEFTTTAAPVVPVCAAPTGISATVNSNTSVTFNWTAANNGALYFVQVKPAGSTWAQAGGASTASTSRTFNYLQPGTSYDYRIRTTCTAATTSNGTSLFSAVGNFATTGNEPGLAQFNTENPSWSIYPNPATDIVNIEFTATEEAAMQLVVLDVAGRKVQEISTQSLLGNNQLQISLASLNKGLYFIQAIQGNEVKPIGKVTKQ